MLYRAEILSLLKQRSIPYELTEHPAIVNMEEAAQAALPYPEDEAKNLFVRDDKKRAYYLITVRGDRQIDLKWFRTRYGTRPLSFANDAALAHYLGLQPGSVTPLGLLNNTEHSVILFLDDSFLEGAGRIGVHPNDNTATLWLKTADLIRLLQESGTDVRTVNLRQDTESAATDPRA